MTSLFDAPKPDAKYAPNYSERPPGWRRPDRGEHLTEPVRDFIWVGAATRFVRWPPKRIIAEVAEKHGLTLADLIGPRRHRYVAHARQEAMWALRQRTTLSTTSIGMFLGGRDHTTVMWGLRRHEERLRAA